MPLDSVHKVTGLHIGQTVAGISDIVTLSKQAVRLVKKKNQQWSAGCKNRALRFFSVSPMYLRTIGPDYMPKKRRTNTCAITFAEKVLLVPDIAAKSPDPQMKVSIFIQGDHFL